MTSQRRFADRLPGQRPWPRFVDTGRLPPARERGPGEPWPRWGWFPREPRSVTFAPGPSITAASPVPPPPPPPRPEPAPARPPRFIHGLVPVRRTYAPPLDAPSSDAASRALVPVRSREVALADVARAVRKAAPVAAVAGVAAVAAMALFRRR